MKRKGRYITLFLFALMYSLTIWNTDTLKDPSNPLSVVLYVWV